MAEDVDKGVEHALGAIWSAGLKPDLDYASPLSTISCLFASREATK